ncbi:MAG: TonB-dependent receptor [Pseudomonadales bacterium]
MTFSNRYKFAPVTLLTIALSTSVNTLASEGMLPEIIVTADYRQSSELDTATSVSIITEDIIKSRSAGHFEDLVNAIPNLNFAGGSNRARFFQIRGIGERSQFVAPLNASVGLLIDNVDFSGAGTIATMMDVQQVEVLRGPQGTRHGANALAGLINIKSNDPTSDFAANVKLSAAEYNTQTIAAMITGSLSDKIQARVAAEKHSSDGYYDNGFSNSEKNNKRSELSLRGKLHIQVTDDWELKLMAARTDINNGYDSFSLDNTRTTLSDEPGHDRQDSILFAIESEWTMPRYNVVALINTADSDIEYGYDEDWSFTGIDPIGYTSTDNYIRDRGTYSAELRILSNDTSRLFGDSTDWIIGAYMINSEEELQREYTYLSADFFSTYEFDAYAIFFQIDSSLSENIILSTGLRIERRDSEYRNSDGVGFSPNENFWGGEIALKYYPSSSTMVYASVARGYKAGGFNTDGSLDEDLREFDEEFLIEYEIGFKSQLLDNRIQLRTAVFYDDRRDQQVKSSIVRIRDDGSSDFIDFTGNAAEGTNKGLEVELNWFVSETFRLDASLGVLDARFDSYINEFGEDLSGRDQAHAPGYMGHIAATYSPGHWLLELSMDKKDDFYFSDRHDVQSDQYTLVNANFGYVSENWRITLWGKNLTNEDYAIRAFGSFGNDPRKFYVTEPYFQYGEPRIVGVTYEVNL